MQGGYGHDRGHGRGNGRAKGLRGGKLALTGVALAGFALALGAVADVARAQGGGAGGLTLPQNITMLGTASPNFRRATAVVNGDVITGTDVNQRLALIIAANQGRLSPAEIEQLRMQTLRNLIDESLQIQEAKSLEVSVDEAEMDATYARFATETFRQTVPALDAYLAKIGSSPASLKRQIRAELSWQRVLRRNVQPFVNVSQEEVKELLQRLNAAKGTDEYRVGEIFLSATPESRQIVSENARRIYDQLREGASFVAYARQYGESSAKSVGGDLGWLRLGQLPNELATVARDMQPGQMAGPVELRGGFSILYMIDRRKVLTADPRDAVLSLKQITISLPANLTDAQVQARTAEFDKAIKGAGGCGGVGAVAARLGAQVGSNDQIRARDLPAPLQQPILSLAVGQATPPFGSKEDGIQVLMLCGRDDAAASSGPNFDQLMSQIEDERVNKRAQAYLRDLRRDAIIEYN
ncbi:peptidylprolyl isomerase [Novosphingobium sp. FSY-8]|uniref:Parvulin-like PPIase n=2 Tax=Novosphingobium ovatum TaxID=1908523 RepID=A0ABW9XAQ5_9SPHN|nr:peptidylprolyl isomerase [Novosphingobium ovatum]NBC35606.1 peptidylprolyl isomerase [Novosphingobium ovatum]